MDTDQEIVREADLALVAATERYMEAPAWEKPDLKPALEEARANWAMARYRLLFPGTASIAADLAETRQLRSRIETAADNQQAIQALLDLASLLKKFAF